MHSNTSEFNRICLVAAHRSVATKQDRLVLHCIAWRGFEEVTVATNRVPRVPELTLHVETAADECTFHCAGRIVSDTVETLKSGVKPAIARYQTVVLDLTDVGYMDSSGLGAIAGLHVSAKTANCQLKLINLNQRLKELFSLTRLGEVLAKGRDPDYLGMP
jgi:anti-sigma B factor antagonist